MRILGEISKKRTQGMTDQDAAGTASRLAIVVICDTQTGAGESRLSPPLSHEEEVGLRACFISDIGAAIAGFGGEAVDGFAAYAPVFAADEMRKLMPPGFTLLPQRGQTRSDRYAAIVDDLLAAGYAGVCLIDAGAPTLPSSVLRDAIAALRQPGDRIILAPALNGGYPLIAIKERCPELFEIITARTARHFPESLAGATTRSLPVEQLSPWYRVFDGLSLTWLMRELLGDGVSPLGTGSPGAMARRTRAYLAALGERGDGAPLDPGLYQLA